MWRLAPFATEQLVETPQEYSFHLISIFLRVDVVENPFYQPAETNALVTLFI